MNFNLHFGELHSNNSINDKNNLFENYIPECYKVKRILISFNCFSEYSLRGHKWNFPNYVVLQSLRIVFLENSAGPD